MCNVMMRPRPIATFAIYPQHTRHTATGEVPCPASGARIFVDTGEVHPDDAAHIRRAGTEWVREVVSELRDGTSKLDTDTADLLRGLLQIEGISMPTAREISPPPDSYFPGRPADAPEPGVGERPAGRPAMDLGGGFLGRAAMENARDQLRGLIALTIDQMASAQDTLARMTGLVDSLVALTSVVGENLRSANATANAAIGTGPSLPPSAEQLRAQLIAALESGTPSRTGMLSAMRVQIELTYSQLAAGIEAAREYQASA